MLVGLVFYYKNLRTEIENIHFIFNPHNICAADMSIRGTQNTVKDYFENSLRFHFQHNPDEKSPGAT